MMMNLETKQRALSEWWTEETEYIFQRIEKWAACARGYSRLRCQRISKSQMSMEENNSSSRWSISGNKFFIEEASWNPRFQTLNRSHTSKCQPEELKLNCCGTLNYKSNTKLDSTCLETYSYDHSIYFKTIGDLKTKSTHDLRKMSQDSKKESQDLRDDFGKLDKEDLEEKIEREQPRRKERFDQLIFIESFSEEDEEAENLTRWPGDFRKLSIDQVDRNRNDENFDKVRRTRSYLGLANRSSAFVCRINCILQRVIRIQNREKMGKRLENVAAMACMTTLLMLFNFAFLCSGILMLCIGIYMRLQLRDYVDASMEGSGVALLALAFLGASVVIAATFACYCTARGHPALLYVYGAFLATIALLDLGAGASVYSYRSALTEGFDQGLNHSLDAYPDPKSRTTHVDFMQSTLQCCGNKAYTDWYNMKQPQAVPLSCCKVPKEDCLTNDPKKIYTQGCYNRVIELINNNCGLVAGIAMGVAFFPIIGLFLACCLANNINKAKYEQVA